MDHHLLSILARYDDSLQEWDRATLNNILGYMAFATRELSLPELSAMCAISTPSNVPMEAVLRTKFAALDDIVQGDGLEDFGLHILREHLDLFPNWYLPRNIEANPVTSGIRFSDPSMRAFLRSGKADPKITGLKVGVNPLQSQYTLLWSCLNTICNLGSQTAVSAYHTLRSYAVGNWIQHVLAVTYDPKELNPEDATEVLKLLFQMFRNEAVLPVWMRSQYRKVFSSPTLYWFHRFVYYSSFDERLLSPDEINCLLVWKHAPASIFFHAAQVAGREWVERQTWNALDAAEIAYRIKCLHEDLAAYLPERMPSDSVFETVEWLRAIGVHIRETPLFYRRMSRCFFALNDLAFAVQQEDEASKLEYGAWVAEPVSKGIDQGPGPSPSRATRDIEDINAERDLVLRARNFEAEAYQCWWADPHKGIKLLMKAFATGRASNRGIRLLFRLRYETEQIQCIILVLKMLEKQRDSDHGCSKLTTFLMDQPRPNALWLNRTTSTIVTMAAYMMGPQELEWLKGIYRTAIQESERQGKHLCTLVLEICLLNLEALFSQPSDKAATLALMTDIALKLHFNRDSLPHYLEPYHVKEELLHKLLADCLISESDMRSDTSMAGEDDEGYYTEMDSDDEGGMDIDEDRAAILTPMDDVEYDAEVESGDEGGIDIDEQIYSIWSPMDTESQELGIGDAMDMTEVDHVAQDWVMESASEPYSPTIDEYTPSASEDDEYLYPEPEILGAQLIDIDFDVVGFPKWP